MIITELRQEFKLKLLLAIAKMPKSSYYYYRRGLKLPSKYTLIKDKLRQLHRENNNSFGYRRMRILLKDNGILLNHKTVLRLMNQINISGKVRRRRKYKSYKGRVGKVAPNIIERNFKAKAPYEKLTTDVTQFNVCGKKVYLSPVLDMYNNEILSYSISYSPNFLQINEMMDNLLMKLPLKSRPILHSDQGWQYQMKSYRKILRQNKIKQSMSRKGNCLDNSIMESFFGRLKIEMFYGEKFSSSLEFICKLGKYLDYYNTKRISQRLDGLTPIEYRGQYLVS